MDPSTWALHYQVCREIGLYDEVPLKGRTELFFLLSKIFEKEKVILTAWLLNRTTFAWFVSLHR